MAGTAPWRTVLWRSAITIDNKQESIGPVLAWVVLVQR